MRTLDEKKYMYIKNIPKIYKKYTPNIYFLNIFDGDKYAGKRVNNMPCAHDEIKDKVLHYGSSGVMTLKLQA